MIRIGDHDIEENDFDALVNAGEEMRTSDLLGDFLWRGRPLTNMEMYAINQACKYTLSAIVDRWVESLETWLIYEGAIDDRYAINSSPPTTRSVEDADEPQGSDRLRTT